MSHDHDLSPDGWERRYRSMDHDWGTRPNAVLADVVTALAPDPGRALDLGAGHGGDALWLAGRGWEVVAADVSATAVERIAEAAVRAGLSDRIAAERHDLTETFPDGAFDLVAASYVHTRDDQSRAALLRRGAEAVRPGGLLVVVDHASVAPWSWDQDAVFPTPAETLDGIGLDPAGWATERCDTADRVAAAHGQEAVVTENVVAVRRR